MGCALPCLLHFGKPWHRVLLFLHIYYVPKDKTITWLIRIKQHNYFLLLFTADNWAIYLNKLLIFWPFKFSFLLPLFNHIFCHSLVTQNSLVTLIVSLLVASIMASKNQGYPIILMAKEFLVSLEVTTANSISHCTQMDQLILLSILQWDTQDFWCLDKLFYLLFGSPQPFLDQHQRVSITHPMLIITVLC